MRHFVILPVLMRRHAILAPAIAGLLMLSLGLKAQQTGWRADPKVVEQTSKQQPSINYDESRVARYTLPDVMTGPTGTAKTVEHWKTRRTEILELFREHVYGRRRAGPSELRFEVVEENAAAMDGAATLKRVADLSANTAASIVFELTLFLPNGRREPRAGLFLLLNNRPATNTDPTRKEKSGFWPAEQVDRARLRHRRASDRATWRPTTRSAFARASSGSSRARRRQVRVRRMPGGRSRRGRGARAAPWTTSRPIRASMPDARRRRRALARRQSGAVGRRRRRAVRAGRSRTNRAKAARR